MRLLLTLLTQYVPRDSIKALGYPDVKVARSSFYRRAKVGEARTSSPQVRTLTCAAASLRFRKRVQPPCRRPSRPFAVFLVAESQRKQYPYQQQLAQHFYSAG
jgi:hypothetical protein